jgi:hypothetical protein
LRLARAEARAAGGSLARLDDALRLLLPVVSGRPADHPVGLEGTGGGVAA